jgi:mevalonate kinase
LQNRTSTYILVPVCATKISNLRRLQLKLSDKYFYGKILLFGEYSIILGSKALSVPYRKVKGKLTFTDLQIESDKSSNQSIRKLFNYIGENGLKQYFQIHKFSDYLDEGLIFDSNIPQGYGVGSSGALVAALYNEFGNPEKQLNNLDLKNLFGKIESFFHGKSSGLDPFLCYTNQPVLINQDKSIEILEDIDIENIDNIKIELIDSETTGKTEPLVNLFLEKCQEPIFKKAIETELIKNTNLAIEYFLNYQLNDFQRALNIITLVEFAYFQEMIPDIIKEIWKSSLDTDNIYIKLCGSGGGGYFLKFEF